MRVSSIIHRPWADKLGFQMADKSASTFIKCSFFESVTSDPVQSQKHAEAETRVKIHAISAQYGGLESYGRLYKIDFELSLSSGYR